MIRFGKVTIVCEDVVIDSERIEATIKKAVVGFPVVTEDAVPVRLRHAVRGGGESTASGSAFDGATIEEKKVKAIAMLKEGKGSSVIAEELGLKPAQVRAYKAHMTMGTY